MFPVSAPTDFILFQTCMPISNMHASFFCPGPIVIYDDDDDDDDLLINIKGQGVNFVPKAFIHCC